ncbi:MAG: M20/M25/M40 family metallo-hydrolase [Bacteroidales bacterium]|nr:M20/M25/M40 family metallo-hydrolase [Bacteroidales bacterium]
MKKLIGTLIIIFFNLSLLFSQTIEEPEITIAELKEHITYLASDSIKGRKPGTPEGLLSAEYIKNSFTETGLKPLADDGFQYFEIVTNVNLGDNNSLKIGDYSAKPDEDYIPYSFSSNGKLFSQVVFAGYGFDIDIDSLKWNDYENIDVNGKWVMLLRGDPEPDNPDSKFYDFAKARDKVLTAKDKGAAGVLLVSGIRFDETDKLVALYYDKTKSGSGIPVLNIKRNIADKILEKNKKTVEQIENEIIENKKPLSFAVPFEVLSETEIIQQKVRTQNVIAVLEGNDPILKDEFIIIGGHYDHLGMGGYGSGSRMPDTIAVHNGADDNASGVSGILEIAEKLAAKNNNKRSIIFMAFGGEEMGLLGSKYFVNNPLIELKNVVAMVNIDMIGRLNESNKILIGGTGTSVEAETILNNSLEEIDIKLSFSPEGFGPSDHASFYAENIPVFFVSTGAHEDYHTPMDDVEKINFEGQKAISDYLVNVVDDLSTRDSALTFREAGPKKNTNFRGRLKITLGIMPDFTSSDLKGLGVGGVRPDGPAKKGGMKKGDLIIAVDGKSVENIYDYMNRLKKLKPGQIITVDIIRNDEKKVLLIQL